MRHTFKEPCGCVYRIQHDREEYVELCADHKIEHGEIHARAQEEHKASMFEFLRPQSQKGAA